MLSCITLLTLLSTVVSALTLTAPTESNGWTQSGDQIITWTPDSSDPDTIVAKIVIPLVNIRQPQILSNNVNTSVGSYIWNQPDPSEYTGGGVGYAQSTVLEPGDGYEVILISHNGTLLAASNFTVSTGTSSVSATAQASYAFIPIK
ncbi:uncharacterized protein IL334_002984 [Kwoniella shivajii]|uniref:Ser-Thr-rich glycosyl-phosphatidyl-inositol-anchored membrane family-domain-containing protein n=1 Tax=Kwoniella shivajii TaxID=564305 RepID=A0ABZ1CW99_9TREE|nr:hypothetical protein IL334_002984 [Kwoniella shivajii]